MEETYYTDEDGVLRGSCPRHGEFVGDAIGCPDCFAEQEEFEGEQAALRLAEPRKPIAKIAEEGKV